MFRRFIAVSALLFSLSFHAHADTGIRLMAPGWQLTADSRGHVTSLIRNAASSANVAGEGGHLCSITSGSAVSLPASITLQKGRLHCNFGIHGTLDIVVKPVQGALIFRVADVHLTDVSRLDLFKIPLKLEGELGEKEAACSLALNLKTNTDALPGPSNLLNAYAVEKFGFDDAAGAVVFTAASGLRKALQAVVLASPETPHSAIGGPWALGKEINSGSYLFNFGDMSEQKVSEWIDLAQKLGVNQIDFHGGTSFRFGDCFPNLKTYPEGKASFKRVIDRLHSAGIKAGLHTYAFFIDKKTPWVTPVPDKRLASDAVFTLATDLDVNGLDVHVAEDTAKMNTVTGFFVFNSITLMVDDELINYGAVQKDGKFAFTKCTRGAFGTHPAVHKKGAKVRHLKECFGLFVPDPETSLLAEVAERTASMFNDCGFDMIYLDALDGEAILGGSENSWHYGSQFVWEINRRLKKPALMEMSTFHHHLWYVRSRMGAWDHPTRSHKEFIDIHCKANETCAKMFLPGQLGWWSIRTWTGSAGEPTYSDDMEYLLCKCIGNGNGLALMGIDPKTLQTTPALPRIAELVKRYEDLRHSGKIPASMRKQLATPASEFTLEGSLKSGWSFRPVTTVQVKPETLEKQGVNYVSTPLPVNNPYVTGAFRLRIEALQQVNSGAGLHTSLIDPDRETVTPTTVAAGINARWMRSDEKAPDNGSAAAIEATNATNSRAKTWVQFQKRFSEPINLKGQEGLGLWVKGDGSGAVLNIQLKCPAHVVAGIGEHYTVLDFTGWRWVELVEPEGKRWANYSWPYGDPYSIYRESTDFSQIGEVSIWLNNLKPGSTSVRIGGLSAMPLASDALRNPSVYLGKRAVRFACTVPAGGYLEWDGTGDAIVYAPNGAELATAVPQGSIEALPGVSSMRVGADAPEMKGIKLPRLRVTLGLIGEAIRH